MHRGRCLKSTLRSHTAFNDLTVGYLVLIRRLKIRGGCRVIGQRRQRLFDLPRPLYSQDRSLARLSLLNERISQFGRQNPTLK